MEVQNLLLNMEESDSFYIVGYSFRDDHINELIKRWMKNVRDYSKGLLIVDYQSDEGAQQRFISFVRKALHTPKLPESCFEFGGANNIHEVEGTLSKTIQEK